MQAQLSTSRSTNDHCLQAVLVSRQLLFQNRPTVKTRASEARYLGSNPSSGTKQDPSGSSLLDNLTGLRTNPAGALATEKWNLVYPATALAMARHKLGEGTLPANDSRRRRTNKAKLGGTPPFLPLKSAGRTLACHARSRWVQFPSGALTISGYSSGSRERTVNPLGLFPVVGSNPTPGANFTNLI